MALARRHLSNARKIADVSVFEVAGREAYLAAFNAALAFVFARTARVTKTHGGLRATFARLAMDEPRLGGFTRFLAEGYELKVLADYGHARMGPVDEAEARDAIATAERMIAAIEGILEAP